MIKRNKNKKTNKFSKEIISFIDEEEIMVESDGNQQKIKIEDMIKEIDGVGEDNNVDNSQKSLDENKQKIIKDQEDNIKNEIKSHIQKKITDKSKGNSLLTEKAHLLNFKLKKNMILIMED